MARTDLQVLVLNLFNTIRFSVLQGKGSLFAKLKAQSDKLINLVACVLKNIHPAVLSVYFT